MTKKTNGGKMRELTAEKIQENYDSLLNTIQLHITGDRKEKVLKMHNDMKDRFMMAPASAKEHYHNAMYGGYVDHILRVVDLSLKIKDLWEQNGCQIDFTDEELVFSALHHDLGKVGGLEHDYYIPQESDWHLKNRGEIFTHNPELQYMTVTDRSCWILQHFEIPMTQWEFIGLRLTDGLYEEGNEKYYKGYNPDFGLRSNIAYILHQADMMATHIESNQWERGDKVESKKIEKSVSNIKKAVDNEVKEKFNTKSTEAKDIFNELFGEKK